MKEDIRRELQMATAINCGKPVKLLVGKKSVEWIIPDSQDLIKEIEELTKEKIKDGFIGNICSYRVEIADFDFGYKIQPNNVKL